MCTARGLADRAAHCQLRSLYPSLPPRRIILDNISKKKKKTRSLKFRRLSGRIRTRRKRRSRRICERTSRKRRMSTSSRPTARSNFHHEERPNARTLVADYRAIGGFALALRLLCARSFLPVAGRFSAKFVEFNRIPANLCELQQNS